MVLRHSPFQVDFDSSGIYVFESRHAPGFEMKMGIWNFDKLCLVQQGNGTLEIADPAISFENTEIVANDIIFVPANIRHRFRDNIDHPMTLVMICFYPDTLGGSLSTKVAQDKFRQNFGTCSAFNSAQTHRMGLIMALLKRMVFEQSTERAGYSAILWGMLVQLLVMLTRSINEVSARGDLTFDDQAFAQTLDFLDEAFTEPVQIKDLATMAGLSYRRYTTLFKQAKGETVNAYITRRRIDYAKTRLQESGNVLFSALESGFGDLSHFYRVFKKETGMTPKKFIENRS